MECVRTASYKQTCTCTDLFSGGWLAPTLGKTTLGLGFILRPLLDLLIFGELIVLIDAQSGQTAEMGFGDFLGLNQRDNPGIRLRNDNKFRSVIK